VQRRGRLGAGAAGIFTPTRAGPLATKINWPRRRAKACQKSRSMTVELWAVIAEHLASQANGPPQPVAPFAKPVAAGAGRVVRGKGLAGV
jgi:hypothetical protein